MRFNEILKSLRLEKKLSQKELAKILNVSEDCIYFWEKARSEPSIDDLINISNYFEITIDYLVGKTEL